LQRATQNILSSFHVKVQYVIHLLPCTHQDDIRHRAAGKAGQQGDFEDFYTHLAVVHSARGSLYMLTSLHLADNPAGHDQLFPHSY
jgi:hypothetical protein